MKCDTVTVTITDNAGNSVVLEPPAYTRTMADFVTTVKDHMTDYLGASMAAGSGMSVADFALYLLTQASQEPREIEV